MIKKRLLPVIFVIFTLMAGVFSGAAEDAPDPNVLDQERRLKEDTETKAQDICDSIFGKDMARVLVNVELGIETVRRGGSNMNRKLDNKSNLNDASNFLLPWVPAPKSVTKEEVPKDASVETQAAQQESTDMKTVVKRFDVTVVHDKTLPEDLVAEAKDNLSSAFERYKNVLRVIFKAASFKKDGAVDPAATVKKNFLESLNLKTILWMLLVLLAFSLLKFFFGPLASFMKDYIDGMKEMSKSKVEMENTTESENETDESADSETSGEQPALTPEEQAALEAEEEAMKKFVPFTYINDENIKQLAYLLHHEEPWVVALVISYLSADHAFKVMEALPADLQAKVALETAMYRQTSLDQVVAINEDIKQKIDFVVGGLDKLVGILENSDRAAQDNILEYLKNEKPGLYERVREHILLFDDIVNFPKQAMQLLVRELKTEDLARALRGASPELQGKFFENMSQGAVTLLREEMEFGRAITDEQIEEERKKIVDMIKVMEKDGKISFRQRGKVATLTGDDLTSAPVTPRVFGGASNPEGAAQAYSAGMAAQEAGNMDEAIRQYESAVQQDGTSLDALQALATAYYGQARYQEAVQIYDQLLALSPNDELRAWVDDLRASLSAAA
jgi:flagellar motor switch protein FliG